jgi:hypothetical protein
MAIFCVKAPDSGWLFIEQPVPPIAGATEGGENARALAVYQTAEDALRDAEADGGDEDSVVEMPSPEVVTQVLEQGRVKYVRIRWADDASVESVCALPGWRYAVEHGLID